MAIATFDRDQARQGSASDPRFKLLERLFQSGDAVYWRAQDRRAARTCVIRVVEAGREDTSRRLGDLHRERTLADRLGHPQVLRTDVPLIEAGQIHQLVDPEPVRLVDPQAEGGRLALLTLLVGVARVLADAHARGVFHGAFTRDCCLRTANGGLLVQGFSGDASAAAAVRDGIAADHHAFLTFAEEVLKGSGGPPPRLRRYFARELAPGAPRPPANALATLADELRESLEDTFPWPAAAAPVGREPAPTPAAATIARVTPGPRLVAAAPVQVAPVAAVVAPANARVAPGAAGPAAVAERNASPPGAVVLPRTTQPRSEPRRAPAASATAPPLPASGPVNPPAVVQEAAIARAAAEPATAAPTGSAKVAAAEIWYPPVVPPRPESLPDDDPPSAGRSRRPWIALLVLVAVLLAVWQFGGKRGAEGSRPQPAATVPAAEGGASGAGEGRSTAEATVSGTRRPDPAPDAARAPAAPTGDRTRPGADVPSSRSAPAPAPQRVVPSPRLAATSQPVRSPSMPAASAAVAGSAEEADAAAALAEQATRSRVSALVAGGNRALNALEPEMAAEAFATALALAPGDGAAIAGAQRARRLAGVAALIRDARDANARGEYSRAVQGYSQALSNDPRNRGLVEALAAARRNLARDATGRLLADGHAALGAGRLEEARKAFEAALDLDPNTPDARRGAEQAQAAIGLRDAATARRVASN